MCECVNKFQRKQEHNTSKPTTTKKLNAASRGENRMKQGIITESKINHKLEERKKERKKEREKEREKGTFYTFNNNGRIK